MDKDQELYQPEPALKKKRGRPPKLKKAEDLQMPLFSEPDKAALVVADHQGLSGDLQGDVRYIYGHKWIVLQNRLLHAISDLSLNERRLVLFLSPLVRADVEQFPEKTERVFVVRTHDFAEQYNLKPSNLYKALEETSISILKKAFFFWDFREDKQQKGVKAGSSWVDYCTYHPGEGYIEIVLASRVVEMLTVFDRNNPYTKYYRDWIVKLGIYGMVLFELIVSADFDKHCKVTYTLNYLRKKFDCEDKYPTYFEFKRNVLNTAIKEIHKHTPYRIEFSQIREGRMVTQLEFSFVNTAKMPKLATPELPTLPKPVENSDIEIIEGRFKGMRVKLSTKLEEEFLKTYQDQPEAIASCIDIANKYIDAQISQGKEIHNLQAVYISSLRKGWGLATLQADKERHVKEQIRQQERQARQEKQAQALKDHQAARDYFLALDRQTQLAFLQAYRARFREGGKDVAFIDHAVQYAQTSGESLSLAFEQTDKHKKAFVETVQAWQNQ